MPSLGQLATCRVHRTATPSWRWVTTHGMQPRVILPQPVSCPKAWHRVQQCSFVSACSLRAQGLGSLRRQNVVLGAGNGLRWSSDTSEPLVQSEDAMIGRWYYRSPYTHLVVGDYKVCREPSGELYIEEEVSRGGKHLRGALRLREGWFVAEVQDGNQCRLQLRDPNSMASQFREKGQPWENEFISYRLHNHDGTLNGWLRARGMYSFDAFSSVRMSILVPSISLAVSGVAYSTFYGLEHGAGLMTLLFIHELGHALMMMKLGVKCGPMVFIPFIGAAVEMQETPAPSHEALIALAGPLLGSAAAAGCLISGLVLDSEVLLRLARWGFVLNIFNLLPIGFLDGGRVAALLRQEFLMFGVALCAVACVLLPLDFLLNLFFLAGCYTTSSWRPHSLSAHGLSAPKQVVLAVSYFSLVALLLHALAQC